MEGPLSASLALAALSAPALASGPEIGEFLAFNQSVLADEDGDFSDWIEIHNDGPAAVDLAGWFLTDDPSDLTLWEFPAHVLPAGARLVVFASGKDRAVPAGELHTSFAIDGDGEYLALVEPGGLVVASEFAPEFPAQLTDVSYGVGSGGVLGYLDPPTPGAPNGPAHQVSSAVGFSRQRGYQDAPFDLFLSCTDANCTIRYTVDGSAPTETTGISYTGPIPISETTVVRAAAFITGTPTIHQVATHTYIFADDVITQSDAEAIAAGFPADWIEQDGTHWTSYNGGTHPGASYGLDQVLLGQYTTAELAESLKSIPSVSLAMPIDDWFGYDPPDGPFGVYVNSELSGDAWDRAGSAEYIDPSGGPEFQIDCGISMQGGSSTSPGMRNQVSIDLKFQSQFGPTKLEFPLFEGSPVERFDYLILDAGNQNSIHSNAGTTTKIHAQGLRDQFMMDLQRAMGGHSPYGHHVHVYLNGLYWGMYDLHERPDERWAAEHFGGSDDEYDWVKEGAVFAGNSNSASHPTAPGAWKVALDIVDGGLDDSDTYGGQPSYELLQEYVDYADYVDYMLLNFYGGNTDWPQRNWMSTSHSRIGPELTDVNPDLEFLFHSWDAEEVLHWGGAVTDIGGFYDRTQVTGSFAGNVAWMYTEMQDHSEFATLFADRAHQHLFNGGALYVDPNFDDEGTPYDPNHPERNRPASVYHDLGERVEKAIVMAFARWANYWDTPGEFTPQHWETERERLLEDYCPIRSGVLLAQLRNKGLYPDLDAPVFSQHGGQVPSGFGVTMTAPGGGTIWYTDDGSDPRLPGGAVSSSAIQYSAAVPIVALTTLRARAFDGSEWSALNEATFSVEVGLRINEFMADNQFTVFDEVGEFEDWVEIYNRSSVAVDLTGMYLSDDDANPTKWPFPAGTVLDPGEHLLVWCDEDPGQGPLHADFKLSKDGESLGIYHVDAADNLPIDTLAFGVQQTDVSQGRLPDGLAPSVKLFDPSPGGPNVPAEGDTVRYDALDTSINAMSLTSTGAPVLGGTLTLVLSGGPALDVAVFFLGFVPVSAPGIQSGTLLVLPDLPDLWQVTSFNGSGATFANYPIPANPGLVGATIYTQGTALSGGLSNALAFTIG